MTFGKQERLVFAMDLRRCFAAARIPVLSMLACAGVLLVVQRSDLPPLVAVCIIALSGLDGQFNNIFYRSHSELEALSLFPISWRGIVVAKNCATICAALLLSVLMSLAILYFSPRQPDGAQFLGASLFVWTVVFPLLIIGNLRSVQEPRKETAGTGDALIQAAGMAVLVLVCSFPYIILYTLTDDIPVTIAYGAFMAIVWLIRSVPRTAVRAEQLLASS